MLFTNTALFAIILVQFLPSDNGLVNAIPTFNGADALLVRKKRQDEDGGGDGEADGDAEGGAEGEGDEKEGDGKEEGDEEGKGEGDEEGKGEGDEEDKKDGDDKEEEKGDEEEGEGKKGGKAGGKKGGKGETPGNGNPAPGGGGGAGAGAGGCIDNADGCERGFCTNVDWARAHCARTCASVLPECKQVASMPDPEKSCIDRADNCGSNADICQDENLAICGCPQKCGRCTQHQNFVAQGRCQSVFGKK
uniref:ShKT domain-containing protein n=1 Tax=Globodera rostochiensis TaxID=31243 RepID=A0A914IBZ9_GLORO